MKKTLIKRIRAFSISTIPWFVCAILRSWCGHNKTDAFFWFKYSPNSCKDLVQKKFNRFIIVVLH